MVVFYRYAVAIIILAMLGSGVIYFRGSDEPERQELTQQDILPAQGVAVLQLSDGQEVPLNSTAIIQEQEGVVIKMILPMCWTTRWLLLNRNLYIIRLRFRQGENFEYSYLTGQVCA